MIVSQVGGACGVADDDRRMTHHLSLASVNSSRFCYALKKCIIPYPFFCAETILTAPVLKFL